MEYLFPGVDKRNHICYLLSVKRDGIENNPVDNKVKCQLQRIEAPTLLSSEIFSFYEKQPSQIFAQR